MRARVLTRLADNHVRNYRYGGYVITCDATSATLRMRLTEVMDTQPNYYCGPHPVWTVEDEAGEVVAYAELSRHHDAGWLVTSTAVRLSDSLCGVLRGADADE